MGMSKAAQKLRRKVIREGKMDPKLLRNTWDRKPQTQRVLNKRAEQRRSFCRNKENERAAFVLTMTTDHNYSSSSLG